MKIHGTLKRSTTILLLLTLAIGTMGADCTPDKDDDQNDLGPLAKGEVLRGPVGEGCEGSTVIDALGLMCSIFGADTCKSVTQSCNTYERQVFTGTRLSATTAPGRQWNGMGGTGELMADAALCSMRELSSKVNGPERTSLTFDIGIGDLEVRQELGFLNFDRVNGSWKGYRKVQFKLPIIGRFDAVAQDITMSKASYGYIRYDDQFAPPLAGNYPITGKNGLNVTTEEKAVGVELWPPGFNVPTPIGTFNVQPKFKYGHRASVIDSPFDGNNAKDIPNFAATGNTVRMTDLYGVNPGTDASSQIVTWDNHISHRTGWTSQLAFGNRNSAYGATPWTPPSAPPILRPDQDISKGRSVAETGPTIAASAEAEVKYPSNPSELLPSWVYELPFLEPIEAYVTVTPKLFAGFTGQFNMFFDEGADHWQNAEFKFTSKRFATFSLFNGLAASAQFLVEAGLRLYIALDLPIVGLKKIIDLNAKFPVPVAGNTKTSPSPRFALGASTSQGVGKLDLLRTFNATHAGDTAAKDFIKQCYANELPADPAPAPVAEKGNPQDLFNDSVLWPCNVCLFVQEFNSGGVQHPQRSEILMPAATGPTWSCDNELKTGCMDLCRFDRASNRLIKVKSAKDIASSVTGTDDTYSYPVTKPWINIRYDGCESAK